MVLSTPEETKANVETIDVFVSYASEDLDRVKPLIAAFEAQGWRVWWDKELAVGLGYDDKIEEALDGSRCIVVLWSSNSIKSQWVRTEAHEGLEKDILVPILIEDVKPPLAFRISQTAKMFDWPDHSGHLETVIDRITELVGNRPVRDETQENQPQIPTQPIKTSSLKLAGIVLLSVVALGAVLMSIDKSRAWLTQSAISLVFDIRRLVRDTSNASRYPKPKRNENIETRMEEF